MNVPTTKKGEGGNYKRRGRRRISITQERKKERKKKVAYIVFKKSVVAMEGEGVRKTPPYLPCDQATRRR